MRLKRFLVCNMAGYVHTYLHTCSVSTLYTFFWLLLNCRVLFLSTLFWFRPFYENFILRAPLNSKSTRRYTILQILIQFPHQSQGHQMVYFKTKNPFWVNCGGSCIIIYWYILWPFGEFYGHLVNFMAIWCTLWSFGIFFPLWYVVPRKIWQPRSKFGAVKNLIRSWALRRPEVFQGQMSVLNLGSILWISFGSNLRIHIAEKG
jgi:hypothetical protein